MLRELFTFPGHKKGIHNRIKAICEPIKQFGYITGYRYISEKNLLIFKKPTKEARLKKKAEQLALKEGKLDKEEQDIVETVKDTSEIEWDDVDKAGEILEKINFTEKHIDDYAEKCPARIKLLGIYVEENPKLKASWVRKVLDKKTVGEWDEDSGFDMEVVNVVRKQTQEKVMKSNYNRKRTILYIHGLDSLDGYEDEREKRLEEKTEGLEKEIKQMKSNINALENKGEKISNRTKARLKDKENELKGLLDGTTRMI